MISIFNIYCRRIKYLLWIAFVVFCRWHIRHLPFIQLHMYQHDSAKHGKITSPGRTLYTECHVNLKGLLAINLDF